MGSGGLLLVLGIDSRFGKGGSDVADCLIEQHVEPEPWWAIGAALSSDAGIRTDMRRAFAGDSVAPDASGMAVSR